MPAVGAVLETTGMLTDDDPEDIAVYLETLPPVSSVIVRKLENGD